MKPPPRIYLKVTVLAAANVPSEWHETLLSTAINTNEVADYMYPQHNFLILLNYFTLHI